MNRYVWSASLLLLGACFSPSPGRESITAGLDPDTGSVMTSSADDPSGGASCGDGVVNGDETDVDCGGSCGPCDDGQGCAAPDDCTSEVCTDGTCQAPRCGDGVVHEGEACDEGGPTDTCTAECTPAECGNGVIEGAEACDDTTESATCNDNCTLAACGDAVLNVTAGETCDDGAESATCNADCTAAACGDGIVNEAASETCDDIGETKTCNVDCTTAACGDEVVNTTAGEACDAGGSNTAECDSDCTVVSCGDGFVNPVSGEECDDMVQSATCDVDCTTATCGDGVVNEAAGEQCDGGAPGECGPDCLFVGCPPDAEAVAMAACMAAYPSCDVVDGGVVGYGPGESTGSNCGPPTEEWRFYCTVTAADNYNCSACTVGEILGPHEPCNCDPGTSPVLGMFCG